MLQPTGSGDPQLVKVFSGCDVSTGNPLAEKLFRPSTDQQTFTLNNPPVSGGTLELLLVGTDRTNRTYHRPVLAVQSKTQPQPHYFASRMSLGIDLADVLRWNRTAVWDPGAKFSLAIEDLQTSSSVSFVAEPSVRSRVFAADFLRARNLPRGGASVSVDSKYTWSAPKQFLFVSSGSGLWVLNRDGMLVANGAMTDAVDAAKIASWGDFVFVATPKGAMVFDLTKIRGFDETTGVALLEEVHRLDRDHKFALAPIVLPQPDTQSFDVMFVWTGGEGETWRLSYDPETDTFGHDRNETVFDAGPVSTITNANLSAGFPSVMAPGFYGTTLAGRARTAQCPRPKRQDFRRGL